MERVRIRMTDGCYVAGQAVAEGEIIEVDARTAHEVLSSGRAEFADEATAKRHRGPAIIAWRDPEAEASRAFERITQ